MQPDNDIRAILAAVDEIDELETSGSNDKKVILRLRALVLSAIETLCGAKAVIEEQEFQIGELQDNHMARIAADAVFERRCEAAEEQKTPTRERWLYRNKEALASVKRGLEQAKEMNTPDKPNETIDQTIYKSLLDSLLNLHRLLAAKKELHGSTELQRLLLENTRFFLAEFRALAYECDDSGDGWDDDSYDFTDAAWEPHKTERKRNPKNLTPFKTALDKIKKDPPKTTGRKKKK